VDAGGDCHCFTVGRRCWGVVLRFGRRSPFVGGSIGVSRPYRCAFEGYHRLRFSLHRVLSAIGSGVRSRLSPVSKAAFFIGLD